MKKTILASIVALSLSSTVAAQEQNVSKYWSNYVDSRAENSDLIDPSRYDKDGFVPPNFSYAGFQRGDNP